MIINNKIEEIDGNILRLSGSFNEVTRILAKDSSIPKIVQTKLEVPKEEKKAEKKINLEGTLNTNNNLNTINNNNINSANSNSQRSSNELKITNDYKNVNIPDFQDYKLKLDNLAKKFKDFKKNYKESNNHANTNPNNNVALKTDTLENENNVITTSLENISVGNNLNENQPNNNTTNTNTGPSSNVNLLKLINMISDNQKNINFHLANKLSKEESENNSKSLNTELEKLQGRIGEALSKVDLKIKAITQGMLNQTIDKEEIVK